MFTPTGSVVGALLVTSLFVGSSAKECTLNCVHGTCAEGVADFSDHTDSVVDGSVLTFLTETSRDGMHCECEAGWTGLHCDREYESCNEKGKKHRCYHGSKCVEGATDPFGNKQYSCDCRAAHKKGKSYAGAYCEKNATEMCGDGTDPKLFCVNGACKDDLSNWRRPCECGSDHVGPHCEFNKGYKPDCVLNCHGGSCKVGLKTYSQAVAQMNFPFHDDVHVNFQYCKCPKGYTGLRCQVEVKECGSKQCFNGAECVTVENKQYCNCTAANTALQSFAGESCEHVSTSFCSRLADHNGNSFCTNGGTCDEKTHKACDCPKGFVGPTCAQKEGEEVKCTKTCLNGGECRKGQKDFGIHSDFDLDVVKEKHDANFEHCVCPPGFTGLRCETEVETCGEGEHLCLHGSKCVKDENDKHACKCDPAFTSTSKVAGKYCEHIAKGSSFCFNAEPGLGVASRSFCVNGGKCTQMVSQNDPHPGCQCTDEWGGEHCETKKVSANEDAPKSSDDDGGSDAAVAMFAVILLLLFVGLAVAGIAFVVRGRRTKTAAVEQGFAVETAVSPFDADDSETHPSTTDKDDEGNEMHNVEII